MTTNVPHNLIETPYRKNIIINGNTELWQRGTTTGVVANQNVAWLADRLRYYNDRSTGGSQYLQSTDVPTPEQIGFKLNYSAEIDITTALATPSGTNEAVLSYFVEGYDFQRIQGGNATLSFWTKSNKTGTYAAGFRNSGRTRSYTSEYTIDNANTWEKKIITVPLTEPTGTWLYTNGTGLNITFCVMAAYATTSTFDTWNSANTPYSVNQVNLFDSTDNYFRITGLQLEKGDVATPLEYRHPEQELTMCQRYYEAGTVQYIGAANGASVFGGGFSTYNTNKRSGCTVTLGTPTQNVNLGGQTLATGWSDGFRIYANTTTSGNFYYTNTFTADAELS